MVNTQSRAMPHARHRGMRHVRALHGTAHTGITFSLRARLSRLTVSHVPGPRTEVRADVVLDVAFGVCETESGKLYLDFHTYISVISCHVCLCGSQSLYTL